jgi:hypothetical protein
MRKNEIPNKVILHHNSDKSFTVEITNAIGDGFYVRVFPPYSDIEQVMNYTMNLSKFLRVGIVDTN